MSTTITIAQAAALGGFAAPLLVKLAAHLVRPAEKTAEVRKTAGLSVVDISHASLRATAKGGLTVRRPACAR